jgi:hypothetical protein
MATIIFFLSLRSKPLKTFLYAIIPLRLKAGSSSRKPASLLLILLLLILKSRIPRSGSGAPSSCNLLKPMGRLPALC